ncbi:unnamed protein product [Protopolystoma xenopodis]|uniref:CASP C-terminal domain-containing protein n=1 Tax=Protopolystoma xenopodis TaxID=117903 RepID=A0A3S4ZTZ1_9PLAT|nr:unnamed protein product [Protopolystoma xenopodis]
MQHETVLRNQVLALQNELESVKQDNLKLYEKVRFLDSYEGGDRVGLADRNRSRLLSSTPSALATTSIGQSTIDFASGEEGLLRTYSSAYEAHISPFEQFNRRERNRRYEELPPHEKIMLHMVLLIIFY